MIEMPNEWKVIHENIEKTYIAHEVRVFYEIQEELYNGLEFDDLSSEEKRIHNRVMQYIKHNASDEEILIWEAASYDQYYKMSQATKATASEPKSPYDIGSFITDLSEVTDAKPVPALFELSDKDGKPQLFMPRGKVCVLASEGGLGKSLVALHLAVSLARNEETHFRNWHNQAIKPKPSSGKVVLLYAEEDKNTCLYRLRQQLKDKSTGKVSDEILDSLSGRVIPVPLCISDRGVDSNLSLSDSIRSRETGAAERRERLYKSLEMLAGDDGLDLIVLDPLAQFGGSDFEVDNGEASRLMRHIQQLTGLPGNPSVLVVHHSAKTTAKKGGKLANAFRGSSAIKDNARWGALLRRVGENDTGEMYLKDHQGRGVIEIVVAKSNYGPGFLKARCISHDSQIIKIEGSAEDSLLQWSELKTVEQSRKNFKKSTGHEAPQVQVQTPM